LYAIPRVCGTNRTSRKKEKAMRKTKPEDVAAQMTWVSRLPATAWSRAFAETSEALVEEIQEMEDRRQAIDERIKARMRVLRLMPARAVREAHLMYEVAQVERAMDSDTLSKVGEESASAEAE
jgi:hypothetical protein